VQKAGIVDNEVDQKIYRTAVEAARRKFSPEFMNRIDHGGSSGACATATSVRFSTSNSTRSRSASSRFGREVHLQCTDSAKKFLLDEGIDFKYGARHLKRAIERFLVYPLSNLVAKRIRWDLGSFW
jgi:ATP-dependent Clp protease ATP-binding subunit ClpA